MCGEHYKVKVKDVGETVGGTVAAFGWLGW